MLFVVSLRFALPIQIEFPILVNAVGASHIMFVRSEGNHEAVFFLQLTFTLAENMVYMHWLQPRHNRVLHIVSEDLIQSLRHLPRIRLTSSSEIGIEMPSSDNSSFAPWIKVDISLLSYV